MSTAPSSTFRHYPELSTPTIQAPRSHEPQVSQKEFADYAQGVNRALLSFTQTLNRELRIIVDQLSRVSPSTLIGNEIVGGTIDGTNVTFTLKGTPLPPLSLLLFNRTAAGPLVLLVQPTDYLLSGNTITIIEPALIPVVDDELVAWYRKAA